LNVFGRRGKQGGTEGLEGVISFFGSYHALRSESVLKAAGFTVRLVPGPRDISPNCGVALRFPYEMREAACALLEQNHVQFEAMHYYP
jgi:hypothetical protein